jgi:hypothetical protein
MNTNSYSPSIELISGAYSSRFWDSICAICDNQDSPGKVYKYVENPTPDEQG